MNQVFKNQIKLLIYSTLAYTLDVRKNNRNLNHKYTL